MLSVIRSPGVQDDLERLEKEGHKEFLDAQVLKETLEHLAQNGILEGDDMYALTPMDYVTGRELYKITLTVQITLTVRHRRTTYCILCSTKKRRGRKALLLLLICNATQLDNANMEQQLFMQVWRRLEEIQET